jgi:branched-chain amino acid transport system ATP-binding protein
MNDQAPSTHTAPSALELVAVDAAYGQYRALFGVSLAVPAGAVVALLGPNGAGKSTVARVASGLVPVTAGRVLVAGRDVTGLAAWQIARAGIAHVPEGQGVFGGLTVEENLVLGVRRRAGRAAVPGALTAAYERFPVLAQRRRQPAGVLSGGQQRLLSLAAVLALAGLHPDAGPSLAPRVLVADELSLGLAPGAVDEVYDGLSALHRSGTALLVVEQQVDRALAIADHAVVLDHGVVVYQGPSSKALAAVEQVLGARGNRSTRLGLTRLGLTRPS